ncbi:MAG: cofactor-independent phosphoglycerate mutase, partial [Planctomycetota bacterium]
MKYAIILPDGCADEPIADLDGQTPLEVASIPNMDGIVAAGRIGMVKTVPKGFSPGSDVATLSVIGYGPQKYYTGRAPLEAAAKRITIEPEMLVFRCNLVTLADGRMENFSAGHVSQPEAEKLIADLQEQMGDERITFHAGVGYRHLVTIRNASEMKLECTPPHDIPGEKIAGHLPAGKGSELIRSLMSRSQEILENHEINQIRCDLGECPANSIWLWGQGGKPQLPSFYDRFGIRASAITAVDLIRGISNSIGWSLIEVEGATGYIDTNYQGKGQAAVQALDEADMTAVHIEAPDEAGHEGDIEAKVKSLEQIDEHIVGPVIEKLRSFDGWRILCLPDHPTPIAKKTHTSDPVPFCMAGTGVVADRWSTFSEAQGRQSDLHIDPGHE